MLEGSSEALMCLLVAPAPIKAALPVVGMTAHCVRHAAGAGGYVWQAGFWAPKPGVPSGAGFCFVWVS